MLSLPGKPLAIVPTPAVFIYELNKSFIVTLDNVIVMANDKIQVLILIHFLIKFRPHILVVVGKTAFAVPLHLEIFFIPPTLYDGFPIICLEEKKLLPSFPIFILANAFSQEKLFYTLHVKSFLIFTSTYTTYSMY